MLPKVVIHSYKEHQIIYFGPLICFFIIILYTMMEKPIFPVVAELMYNCSPIVAKLLLVGASRFIT